jgi:ribosomal protein L34E
VRDAARRALTAQARSFPSQASFRRAVVPLLKREDPLFSIGGRRLRRLLIDAPGVRLRVRYAERENRAPLQRCPICQSPVTPIRNRTLWDDRVTLGYRCPQCGYWTHLRRRVPIRYEFVPDPWGRSSTRAR